MFGRNGIEELFNKNPYNQDKEPYCAKMTSNYVKWQQDLSPARSNNTRWMRLVVLEMLLFLVKVAHYSGVVVATGLSNMVARRLVSILTFVFTVFFLSIV